MINWDRIGELRDEIGDEDFAEVVELFLAEVEEVMDKLRASSDRAALEEDLHFLKGSALNLGFQELTALCETGESQARANDANSVDLNAIVSAYDASKSEFLRNLPS